MLWLGLGLLLFSSCTNSSETQLQYSDFVNPFIGTGGHGHTFPGAVVPHGMIQPSPDTRIYEWDACSGYHYSDSTINGFSHTHLSGTGCGDYGDILLMPTVGKQDYRYLGAESQQTAYASPFSHSRETATPGYYSVMLDRYQVKAELTATERAAMHRYHFPDSQQAGFIVDLDYSLQGQQNLDMKLNTLSDTEIVGWKRTKGWADNQSIGFYMKFSKPFTCQIVDTVIDIMRNGKPYKLEQKKALLQFATTQDEEVLVKVGISAVDIDGARRNVETEIPHWDFDSIAIQAKEKWNDYLGTIEVETDNETQKRIFYTALYHTAIHPSLFSDADGRYRGLDQMIHQTKPGKEIYTVYSLWDTFRALHPLLTITQPELNDKLIMSLMEKYHEGGILPMWELAGNYTATMIGYHAVPVIVDAYMKGFNKIDGHELLEACIRSSVYDTTGIIAPSRMVNGLVPISKYYKNKIGYIPYDKENESVAKGLEYAYNDWCISQLAEAIGDTTTYEKYKGLSQAYANYYDAQTKFMRGKDLDGKWHSPDETFEKDIENLMEDVKRKIDYLRYSGVSQWALEQLVKPELRLSRLVVTDDCKIILPDYNNMNIQMQPLVKSVYLLFLRHGGILFKYLSDYRNELYQIYDKVRRCSAPPVGMTDEQILNSIRLVTDPLSNSINEKCTRIREAFISRFDDDMAKYYYITGRRGEPKCIKLPRNMMEFKW